MKNTDNKTDELMICAIRNAKGIVDVKILSVEDYQQILDMEQAAEKMSLMGLGKVTNTGVREVLSYDLVYVALTNMDFDWGCYSTLLLKKGDDLVGEEVRNEEMIARLSAQKNVWFMHKNFVVYKDKISFPHDIMKKNCYFEIPCLPAEWCIPGDDSFQCNLIMFANPATTCDVYLKGQYFDGTDEKGLGTILVGVKL